MRKIAKPTEQEIREGPQAVSFQIANGNMRQRCVLQTRLPTKAEAQKYFLTNWLIIEKMARAALAAGNLENGEIKLVMALIGHSKGKIGVPWSRGDSHA